MGEEGLWCLAVNALALAALVHCLGVNVQGTGSTAVLFGGNGQTRGLRSLSTGQLVRENQSPELGGLTLSTSEVWWRIAGI